MSVILPPLPYALEALEPHISRRTLGVHHGNHQAAYVAKTRALIQRTPLESATLEKIVPLQQQSRIRRSSMHPRKRGITELLLAEHASDGGGEARGDIAQLIEESFGHSECLQRAVRHVSPAISSVAAGLGSCSRTTDCCIIATSNARTP